MKVDILTLFPKMFNGFLEESIIKRAINNGLVTINIVDFRSFSTLPHNQVDDTPYGGGRGMVLMCEPIVSAIKHFKTADSYVIMMSPQGKPLKESLVRDLSKKSHLIIVCGHYEGFDERILKYVDEEISIGDYVLTGGELPSMVLTDAITRLIPGVINDESSLNESFENDLLDYPTYTKPYDFFGDTVPDVLLSGNHAKIKEWRRDKQIEATKRKRPDLWRDS